MNAFGIGQNGTLIKHGGIFYTKMIEILGTSLNPQAYFEIGTDAGISLKAMKCASVAVDPQFRLTEDVIGSKPSLHMFQMPSDDFFRDHSPIDYLKRPIELAFLDGMHRFEYLLRDFANTERYCRKNSIILLHDCLPTTTEMMSRAHAHGAWTGDVWKVLPALRKYRSDLQITYLDCPPTGLVAITNLDPNSSTISDSYFSIVREFVGVDGKALRELYSRLALTKSGDLQSHEELTKLFWL
ncbi:MULTISPECIES: class I SAM-dependent methyltransferase [unclassified Mesorhizobium]|uniref:class I SAM-dependent methyltransferase n=1 Tax=unclassified Mesorhizobium TaxID=325217 RepID=UPI000FD52A0D|nr:MULTISPECIES: class I SAM-dependent methyltransferase [unclassified Mesorhizobium]RUX09708.1 class I SAM-dependent methyltransferase [Mesorhizobium sp. M8A.F.Ca.ET.059.01.1.1]RWC90062.1 MAG: class I SAM-dependent methyltransferase [Mesorhizobium sp.]TGT41344.1 class I SAM-dependent methyltransferase [Mesorhizobium sp. M8A.F.Ca.ET.165.01.1.1]